ncbi:MAG: UDP-N-acetylglucosamine 2-epimerase (non-hydrolyzing), partial [Gemmatimonadota bacterium]|nr:UDP-N-acetylglucosamine 2-epimerase (non-hydrolyzing) [Gemmatimonadota bacterium]
DVDRIVDEASRLLTDRAAYAAMGTGGNPFGDGRASGRIVAVLAKLFVSEAAAHDRFPAELAAPLAV